MVCLQLMSSYELSEFTLVLTDTLTYLSLRYTAVLGEHVGLLLRLVEADKRTAVQLGALRNLNQVASARASVLTTDHLQRVLKLVDETVDERVQIRALSCVKSQLASPGSPSIAIPASWIVMLEAVCLLDSATLVSVALQCLVTIVLRHNVVSQAGETREGLAQRTISFIVLKLGEQSSRSDLLLTTGTHAILLLVQAVPSLAQATQRELASLWIAASAQQHPFRKATAQLMEKLCVFAGPASSGKLLASVAQLRSHVFSSTKNKNSLTTIYFPATTHPGRDPASTRPVRRAALPRAIHRLRRRLCRLEERQPEYRRNAPCAAAKLSRDRGARPVDPDPLARRLGRAATHSWQYDRVGHGW